MKTKKGFELRSVGGEHIIVASGIENIDFTKIISMNSSSAWLWQQVDGDEFTEETLAELLTNKYEVDASTSLADARRIATQWLEAGIIEK